MPATDPASDGTTAIDRSRVAYTAAGAAEQLSLSLRAVYSLIKSGDLPSVKFGRARRVLGADLEEFARRSAAEVSA